MLTDCIVPEERVVACPNHDVVYGFGIMDFAKEPVIEKAMKLSNYKFGGLIMKLGFPPDVSLKFNKC